MTDSYIFDICYMPLYDIYMIRNILLILDDDLISSIEEFRFAGHHKSRLEAIRHLLRMALDQNGGMVADEPKKTADPKDF